MDIRVGIRQWWALTALAAADPSPVTVTGVRQAIRVFRAGDPAKDVTDSLLRQGLVKCVAAGDHNGPGHACQLRLTHAGWASRMNGRARNTAASGRLAK